MITEMANIARAVRTGFSMFANAYFSIFLDTPRQIIAANTPKYRQIFLYFKEKSFVVSFNLIPEG